MKLIKFIIIALFIIECASPPKTETEEKPKKVETEQPTDVRFFELKKDGTEVYTVKAEHIEASVSKRGQITLGLWKNGKAYDLLFGHLNDAYAEGMGTTVISVKIGEEVKDFLDLQNLKVVKIDKNVIEVQGKWPDKEIYITEKIERVPDRDSLRMYVYIKNNEKTDISAGTRWLLDTWAGTSDGVPFAIPGASEDIQTVYTDEVKFTPILSPVWETYDSENSGTIFLRAKIAGDGLFPPDELSFANWGYAFTTVWDYPVDSTRAVTGDSAILALWKEKTVSAGSTHTSAMEFSFVEKSPGLHFTLDDPKKGRGILEIQYQNDTNANQELIYELKSSAAVLTENDSLKFKYNVPAKSKLSRTVLLNFQGNGDHTMTVSETLSGNVKNYTYPFKLTGLNEGNSPPVWTAGKKYPITYLHGSPDLKLTGMIKNPNTGKLISSGDMIPKKQNDGNYLYECELDSGDYIGQVQVEIQEKEL